MAQKNITRLLRASDRLATVRFRLLGLALALETVTSDISNPLITIVHDALHDLERAEATVEKVKMRVIAERDDKTAVGGVS